MDIEQERKAFEEWWNSEPTRSEVPPLLMNMWHPAKIAALDGWQARAALTHLTKSKCHVCQQPTDMACSDCKIDLGATVYVCGKSACTMVHDCRCPHELIGQIEKLNEQIGGRNPTQSDREWAKDFIQSVVRGGGMYRDEANQGDAVANQAIERLMRWKRGQ